MTGSSHGNPGFRHGLPTTNMSYSASWQPGPAPVGRYAHNFSIVSSGEDANEDQHEVKESLQCTGDQQVAMVTSECSQPQPVQSTTSSSVEETSTTKGALVTLSRESKQALKLYVNLCNSFNKEELCIGQGKSRAKFAEVKTNELKIQKGQLYVPLHVLFPCEFKCCTFCICGSCPLQLRL